VKAIVSGAKSVTEIDEEKLAGAIAQLMAAMSANANAVLSANEYSEQRIEEFWSHNGHIGTEREQHMDYVRELLKLGPRVKHICEVGLNAGHSAALFLAVTSHHEAVYHSLDLFEQLYSQAATQLLKSVFGERFIMVPGNSQDTMTTTPSLDLCQVWSLDGDHGPGAIRDISNALAISPNLELVMTDDVTDDSTTPLAQQYSCHTNVDAWKNAVAATNGKLVSKKCKLLGKKMKNASNWCSAWCFGTPATKVQQLDLS